MFETDNNYTAEETAQFKLDGTHKVLTAIRLRKEINNLGLDFNPAMKLWAQAQADMFDEKSISQNYLPVIQKCDQAIVLANEIVVKHAQKLTEENAGILNGKSVKVTDKLAEVKALLEKGQDMKRITPLCVEIFEEINQAQEVAEKQRDRQLHRVKYLQERLEILEERLKEVNKDIQPLVEGIMVFLPAIALEKASANLDRFEMLIGAAEKYLDSTKSVLFGKL